MRGKLSETVRIERGDAKGIDKRPFVLTISRDGLASWRFSAKNINKPHQQKQ
jgi:hypothetical protein